MTDLKAIAYDVPVEYRDRFVELLDEDPVPVSELAEQVASYLHTVRLVAAQVKLLRVDRAERLGQVALTLLETPDHDAAAQRAVQAAVQYFLLEDPDEEVTGVLGLDDDVQVFNAVCRGLGRDDLVVPFRRQTP